MAYVQNKADPSSVVDAQLRPRRVNTKFAAQKLNASTFLLGNVGWARVLSMFSQFVTSATVGNRVALMQFLDSAGNILYTMEASTNLTASITWKLLYGGGITRASGAANQVYCPFPDEIVLPPGSKVKMLDNAAVDTGVDTCDLNIIFEDRVVVME
jgi:hypothetical protein